MRDRRDCADDTERGMLDHGQAMIAAINLASQELNAWRSLAECLELLDLVLQPADFPFRHFHRAELDALIDGNPANMVDDPLAGLDRPLLKLRKGITRRRH